MIVFFSSYDPTVVYVSGIIFAIFIVYFILYETTQLIVQKIEYFKNIWNLLDVSREIIMVYCFLIKMQSIDFDS